MAEKDAKLLACCRAIGEGKFPGIKDCDVRKDCVLPGGYRLGEQVQLRRHGFGADPDADERLLAAGFVRSSARCTAARVDDAFERHVPVLRDAAECGLARKSSKELKTALVWFARVLSGASCASDVADNVYLELAKELGKLAPKDAKGGRWGTEVYWAHHFADQARAVLGRANEEDEEEAAEAVSATSRPRPRPRRAASGRAPAVVESSDDEDVAAPPTDDYEVFDDEEDDDAPVVSMPSTRKRAHAKKGDARPSKRTQRRAAVPDESVVEKKIDPLSLKAEDWDPNAPMAEKDDILVACCLAIGAGKIPGLTDCDVRTDCVLPSGYQFGEHVKRRRRSFDADPDADQRLLDAGFLRVSANGNAASADEAFHRYGPMLRDAARRGRSSAATPEIWKAYRWFNRRMGEARSSDDIVLNLAVKLGDAAPASCRWAKNAAKRASAVLKGEGGEDAPIVPKKRKRAAARAKPVKKPSRQRR